MSSQIARKLDSLATVNALAVRIVYTEGCAKTATGFLSACKFDSTFVFVSLSVTSMTEISYSTHHIGKMYYYYSWEKFSSVVSRLIGLNFDHSDIRLS